MYLQLKTTPREFRQKVLQALCIEMNKAMRGIVKKILPDFKKVIQECFISTPAYDSLLSGKLRGAFGFPNGTEVKFVNALLKAIVEDIEIIPLKCYTNGTQIAGGLQINVVRSTLENILNSEFASHTVSTNDKSWAFLTSPIPQSFNIPWMEWLLVDGDKVQVMNFAYIFKFAGRSAHGIMAPTKNQSKFFSMSRVDPQFAGVINDNWITRTLEDFQGFIELRLAEILERELTK